MKRTLLAASLAVTAGVAPAMAQEFPARPIEMIVPAPAGGGTDVAARMLASQLSPVLSQPVAVLNVAGGGGSVGVTQFMRAQPDGYTLLATWNSPITSVPHVQPVQYKLDSFTPIVSTSETAYTLCVKPDFPADDGPSFIEEIRNRPDHYTYGNDGIGGMMQLAVERLSGAMDLKLRPIPFRGAGETLQNFLGGHVDIYGGTISPVVPYVQSGEAKCLIVTSADPVEALPGASSFGQLGHPELETVLWRFVLGPKDLPEERRAILADAIEKAVHTPEYLEFLAKLGESPRILKGEELTQRINAEYEGLGEALRNLGLAKN
ncbi:tripartite tricarboxylate transporter substrate binding protein [Telmatospirillum sp. J64-1]|uniref:Bug family tripartite tricarboxylate transporter substrate binding protein n=1 Tax=Telmatospirillum sp. J64-1 TaxID=2502183 RepID=UPI00115E9E0A|nr:tripartite tricarboxylate transporter substrate binding protein [Telmatospirillum sp. J64-1]